MISGSDTVLVACGDVRKSISQFLEQQLRDWPEMRLSISGVSDEQFAPWRRRQSQIAPEGEILVARDETMEAKWDEAGYALGSDAEGPFAIYYEPVKRAATQLSALVDPYDRVGFRFEPYELILVGRGLTLVTLVTPDLDSPFSRRLVDSLIAALGR